MEKGISVSRRVASFLPSRSCKIVFQLKCVFSSPVWGIYTVKSRGSQGGFIRPWSNQRKQMDMCEQPQVKPTRAAASRGSHTTELCLGPGCVPSLPLASATLARGRCSPKSTKTKPIFLFSFSYLPCSSYIHLSQKLCYVD